MATGRFASERDATAAIQMAGIPISESQVGRLAREVGQELIEQRDQKVIDHRHRQLVPRTSVVPSAVVVEIDGGRMYTRATGQGPGVHEVQNKEDKVACLVTLDSHEFPSDPQPEPPPSFREPRRVQRLVQQMKGDAGEANASEIPEKIEASAEPVPETEAAERWSPQRLVRTCVASLQSSDAFGPMVAAEAQERGFYQASRQAFVADGLAYNWSIHRGYFPHFEPIVDFLHVLCYVYTSARAVHAEESAGWSQYLEWMQACWQGRVAEVIRELEVWQERLGLPPRGEPVTAQDRRDPRRLVAEARSYLTNNQTRMDYPRYRQLGLPTTSSLVESLVGEINARVKSKQKYWNRPAGGEVILQLRAAVLSEDERLRRYFETRPGSPFRKRRNSHPSEDTQPMQTAA